MNRRFAIALLLALVGSGCSQIAVLAPVASRVTSVRAAALDILVDRGIDMMTSPVCTVNGDDISCVGSTFEAQPITVESHADNPSELTVVVGGVKLYAGSVQTILDEHAGPS